MPDLFVYLFSDAWNAEPQHHMGAMAVLLSRNIKLDGMEGGWELGYGGRVLIGSVMEEDGKNSYWRAGYGQFSNVEFKVFQNFTNKDLKKAFLGNGTNY